MRRIIFLSLLAGLLLPGCRGCGKKEAKPLEPDVVISVNGDPIRIDEVELAVRSIPTSEMKNYTGPDGLQKVLHELTVRRLMIQWAEEKGMADHPAVKKRLERERDRILLQTLLEQTVSDQEINKYFQEHFIRASYLLVLFPKDSPTPEEREAAKEKALKIYEQLQSGVDFTELVQKERETSKEVIAEEFTIPLDYQEVASEAGPLAAEALFSLKDPGAYSEPVEGARGYFIFVLIEPPGQLSIEWLTPAWKAEIRSIREEEVYRSYANTLLAKPENEIVEGPAYKQLMEDYLKAWQGAQDQLRQNEETEISPAVGTTAQTEPGSDPVQPPGPSSGSTAP